MCSGECKKETITIPLEEYKDLLVIKGRYEEVTKSFSIDYTPYQPTITYLRPEITD